MSRILGIDYGDVRVGLAVSDELGITAQGLDTLKIDYNLEVLISKIKELITKLNISDIVIGYPKNMNGSMSDKTKQVDLVITKLESFNLPIHKIDERLTTVSSYRTMKELGIKQKKKNIYADKLAATYILETYLAKIK